MRTRTRIRDKETQSKKKAPPAPPSYDFFDEDYKAVKKLLGISPNDELMKKSDNHESEGRSSTEEDLDHLKARKARSKTSARHSMTSGRRDSDDSIEIIELSSSNGSSSDEKRINRKKRTRKYKPTRQKDKFTGRETYAMKKRTRKQQLKISQAFSTFWNLVSKLNNENSPKHIVEDILHKEDSDEHSKEEDTQNLASSNDGFRKAIPKSTSSMITRQRDAPRHTSDLATNSNYPNSSIQKSGVAVLGYASPLQNEAVRRQIQCEDTTASVSLVDSAQQMIGQHQAPPGYVPMKSNSLIHVK